MRLQVNRSLTFLLVLLAFGWTVSCGWNIVCFSLARLVTAAPEDRARAVQPWMATPGLADAALQSSLTSVPDSQDVEAIRKRAAQLAAIAAVRPMSSLNWLLLSSMRLGAGMPFTSFLAALQMSSLTGPNEGQVVAERAIIELWQWENLSPSVRHETASGLAQVMLENVLSAPEQRTINGILATKQTPIRQEIADLLHAKGLSATELGRIGL
jgi:hypothetical protein